MITSHTQFGLFAYMYSLPRTATPTICLNSKYTHIRTCVYVPEPSNSILFHYRYWFLWKHYRFRKTTLLNIHRQCLSACTHNIVTTFSKFHTYIQFNTLLDSENTTFTFLITVEYCSQK